MSFIEQDISSGIAQIRGGQKRNRYISDILAIMSFYAYFYTVPDALTLR